MPSASAPKYQEASSASRAEERLGRIGVACDVQLSGSGPTPLLHGAVIPTFWDVGIARSV